MRASMFLVSGRKVDPCLLTRDDIDIVEIAHSLSLQNRYNGHTLFPLSVAQHCALLSELVPPHLRRAALIHDASESFVGDLVAPLKPHFPEFLEIEDHVQGVIFKRFNEDITKLREISIYDRRIAIDEMEAMMVGGADPRLVEYCKEHGGGLGARIESWDYAYARRRFLERFSELFPEEELPHVRA